MVHEAYHAVLKCLLYRSDITSADDGGEETTAYVLTWLVKKMLEARKG